MQSLPFIPAWPELRPFSVELWLIAAAIAVLFVPFCVRKPNTAAAAVALVGVVGGFISLLVVRPSESGELTRFSAMLASDGLASLWKGLLLLFTAGVILLWFATTRHTTHEGDGPEFFLLLLVATIGMSLMASASNLLMIFLAVEMASLPSYVLAGFRKTHRSGAEASLKYVLFGTAASAVMVWGLSLVYGLCGTLNLYPTSGAGGTTLPGVAAIAIAQPQASAILLVGLLAVVVGLAFKISAVPFHLWCPDVFEGASVDVTTFLSVASKGAGLVLLMRISVAFADAAGFTPTTLTSTLAAVLGVMGAITCTVGNTAAYTQQNLKRLFAYSSIAHAGYMLCLIALLVDHRQASPGSALGTAAMQALLFYLAVYLFMNLGAFAVIAVVERATGGGTLRDFSGLARRAPLPAICMAVCCFSLVGVPPLAGFSAKFNVMILLATDGGWGWVLVAVIGLNTLLSIYYYLRIVRAMFLEDAGDVVFVRNRLGTGIAVTSAVALLVLFIGANQLSRLMSEAVHARSAVVARPAVSPRLITSK